MVKCNDYIIKSKKKSPDDVGTIKSLTERSHIKADDVPATVSHSTKSKKTK